MGLLKLPLLVLLFSVFSLLSFTALCDDSELTVKFLRTPHAFSNLNSTVFVFEVLVGGSSACTNCNITCKLDDGLGRIIASECENGTVLCEGLQDGNHKFEVCPNGSQGVGCGSYNWTVDRRSINLTTHVPEWQLELNGETRLVRATNKCVKLRICLTFPAPVLNSSSEILNSIKPKILYSFPVRQGTLFLVAFRKEDPWHHRFEFKVNECISGMAIVTIRIDENSIISRQGTPFSEVELITFLFDSLRPTVELITLPSDSLGPDTRLSAPRSGSPWPDVYMRTREPNISIMIRFTEPVYDFNPHKMLIVDGGKLRSVQNKSEREYAVVIEAENDSVSIIVPENAARDVAGNKNSRSNFLIVRHYSVPIISTVISTLATASFVATSVAAGLLTVSIASLSSIGTFSTSFSSFSDPASNLFRMASHIQVFALSRWLAVTLPVEYYEFARALRWSIPYFNLPWKTGPTHSGAPANSNSYGSKIHDSGIFSSVQHRTTSTFKKLLPEEYKNYFEYLQNNSGPNPVSDGWEDFSRSMFWLAIIGGSLILLHALILVILKSRKQKQRGYGVLAFPRFEIFLVNLAVPNICEASAALIKGGTTSGIVVGTLILVAVSFLLLDLLWFLTTGITFSKLVLYNEDNQVIQVGRRNPRIARLTLGAGNKGQWTWNNEKNSDCLTILGPLFEDLRGPIFGGNVDTHGDAPYDTAEEVSGGFDVAPPSLAQSMSRSTRPSRIPPTRSSTVATPTVPLTSSTSAGTHGDYQIIAPDEKTEEVEVSGGSVHTHAETPSIQNLFMKLRVYYTLLESVRRVLLGAMGGAYKHTWSSKIPVIILLCITSLQLLFLVLEKPFIKKRVQLVEIISVSSEVCLFALFLVLLEDKELSPKQATIFGVSMLVLFLMGFLPQIVNELYALRRQIKQLDIAEKRFRTGLRIALSGILLLISLEPLENSFPESFGDNNTGDQEDEEPNDTGNQGDEETNANERDRNSGGRDKNSRNSNRDRKRNRKLETTVP